MAATIVHWGLHPWAISAIVGLALAVFAYSKGLPLTMRSAFHPVLGERVRGWPGHVIDTLAVFAILFGLATSLGLCAEQAKAGLAFLFGIPDGDATRVILIVAITAVAIGPVLRGIEEGVKKRTELNMLLAAALVPLVLFAGPTLAILTGFFTNLRRRCGRTRRALDAVRARRRQCPPGLDRGLLGLLDLLVALRRHVHRPRQPKPQRP